MPAGSLSGVTDRPKASTEADSSFEYNLDGAGFVAASSPLDLSALADALAGLKGGSTSTGPRASVELTVTDARGAQAVSSQPMDFVQQAPSQPRTGCPRSLRAGWERATAGLLR